VADGIIRGTSIHLPSLPPIPAPVCLHWAVLGAEHVAALPPTGAPGLRWRRLGVCEQMVRKCTKKVGGGQCLVSAWLWNLTNH
jgi:hypothetical protein